MPAASADVQERRSAWLGCQACRPGIAIAHLRHELIGGIPMKQTVAAALAILAISAAPALAQAKKSASPKASGGSPDQAFAREAAAGGLDEVALGTLAKEKASSSDVK